jgi:DNA polymerase V
MTHKKRFALADCDSFYASCEQVFAPHLKNRPVVVLSNNDGCVIARSRLAKAVGVRMGEPAFLREDFFKRHSVAVFSANFALYGDMSRRVMDVLSRFSPDMEIYSIDEAFLGLTPPPGKNSEALAREARATVLKWTGIPVSLGLGSTKTRAKVAARFAKTHPDTGGVFDLEARPDADRLLDSIDVGDVWGVGRRYARMLASHGIRTALQLKNAPDHFVKRRMTITGLATVRELRGEPLLALETAPPPKQSILTSRSFGWKLNTFQALAGTVAEFAARCAEKLRAQNGEAALVSTFILTDTHDPAEPQHTGYATLPMAVPTAHTARIITRAKDALETIYRPGHAYKKAGVMLSGLSSGDGRQYNLLDDPPDKEGERLMAALDAVNRRWGRGSLQYAAANLGKSWRMRQARKSPRFTTDWDELPLAKAG